MSRTRRYNGTNPSFFTPFTGALHRRTLKQVMKTTLALLFSLVASAGLAASFSASTPFQIRLASKPEPGAPKPAHTERLTLHKVNRADGKHYVEVFDVDKTVLLDQTDVQSTSVVTNATGQPEIDVTFTAEGTKRFADVTRKNLNHYLAIVINGQLYSAPIIRSPITEGKAVVTGNFSAEEAESLSRKINESLKH